jgi:Polysaccharide deacetylase
VTVGVPERVRSPSPMAVAARGKGSLGAVRRVGTIGARYGFGPERMQRRVASLVELMERFDCRATLPVTAAAVERNPQALARYADLGVEFAVHGYYHVDHASLGRDHQLEQLAKARRLLTASGLQAEGFRAPYLRWTDTTLDAVRENGFGYDTSQAMHWPLDPGDGTETYLRALEFYGSVSAVQRPVLPRIERGVVRIPYCLPDDEAVVERLGLGPGEIARLWVGMFHGLAERGELFTLAVHPERVDRCLEGIEAVLTAATSADRPVWFAHLDEVARWWTARSSASVDVVELGGGSLRVAAIGPEGLSMIARGMAIAGAEPWGGRGVRAPDSVVEIRAARRPFIAVHPSSAPALSSFLRQQGYIVEAATDGAAHSMFLHRPRFGPDDELELLWAIERVDAPLLRFSRWPGRAGSAVCLTGDLDALTLWDFASRALGR